MITAIALCLHLYGLSTATGNGHPITDCREEEGGSASFVGPDGHRGHLLVIPPKLWPDALAVLSKKVSGSTSTTYSDEGAHVAVLLHAPWQWLETWVHALGAGCLARTDLTVAQADLAREKSNPSGVVDLRRMHGLGERIQADQAMIGSYRTTLKAVFPDTVCQ
jgi:hypothetical protein